MLNYTVRFGRNAPDRALAYRREYADCGGPLIDLTSTALTQRRQPVKIVSERWNVNRAVSGHRSGTREAALDACMPQLKEDAIGSDLTRLSRISRKLVNAKY